MKTEAHVWALVRENMPPGVMAKRIEDASGDLGTFDVWVGWNGRGGWIELKHTATERRKPTYRKGQGAFAQRLLAAGVPCAVLVGSGDGITRVILPKARALPEAWPVVQRWEDFSQENIKFLLYGMSILR